MFHKDTLRLIKKTYKRFLAIFFMVLIGVAFMVGLLSTAPIMRQSVDAYYDKTGMMDVQLYSSYGFCDEDVKALRDTSGVKDVFASKFKDLYAKNEKGDVYVTRVSEIDAEVNEIELVEGRLPSGPHEALALTSSSFGDYYAIGEKITLYLEDDEVLDYVAYDEYEIVGLAKSPLYMSSTKETSTLDNLTLESVIYVDNDDLLSEYYTSIYLTFEDTLDKEAFTSAYDTAYERAILPLENTVESQQDYLKNDLMAEYEKEIEEGQNELDENTELMEEEFAKAQEELDDAYITLVVSQAQLNASKTQLETGEATIRQNEEILNASKSKVEEGIKLAEEEAGMSFDDLYASVEAAYDSYNIILASQSSIDSTNAELQARIDANNNQILDLQAQKDELIQSGDLEAANQIEAQISALESSNAVLNEVIKNNTSENYQSLLDEMDAAFPGGVVNTYVELSQLNDAREQIASGESELASAKAELEASRELIESSQAQLASGRSQYESGVAELERQRYEAESELEKAQNELDKARQELEELPEASWTILSRDESYASAMYAQTIDQMAAIGYIFPLLFFLVAALVCMTTMTRLVDEERSQIGIFSALGFSKNQIIFKYVLYALLACLLGAVIGVFVGMPIFPPVIYNTWKLMYDLPAMRLSLTIPVAFVGIFSFAALVVLVTYLVARRTLKEVPSELMRPKAPKNAKRVLLEYIKPLWRALSFTSKITARNIFRYKSRFLMTVIGVAGCTSLLVLGFGIKDGISGVLDTQFKDIFSYNYTINLSDDYNSEKYVNELLEDSANEQVVPFMTYSTLVYLNDENDSDLSITLNVFDEREIDRVMNLRDAYSGEDLVLGDGVIISEKFAINEGLQEGDLITIESEDGLKKSVVIDAICEMYFNHYMFMSSNTYEDLFNQSVHNTEIAVIANDQALLNDFAQSHDDVISLSDFDVMIDNFEVMLRALDIIIIVIILASGSLAFVVLFNLTEVNISERKREIATLKVLGFNDREVYSYIFKEIGLLTFIGALLGLPLGKVEQKLVLTVINMDMVMFGNDIKALSYIYSMLITFAFVIIVLTLTSKQLRKIEMVESLKSVE